MDIENWIEVKGNWVDIWRFSSEIEHWPTWLPHYRKVKIIEILKDETGQGRVRRKAFMSAWRDILPVSWTTIQTLVPGSSPQEALVLYRHIGGVTKGMKVEWSFQPTGSNSYRLKIMHEWSPAWPLIGKVASYLIQTLVVHDIAEKTLARVKRLVSLSESSSFTQDEILKKGSF